jgi:hypothetical protein
VQFDQNVSLLKGLVKEGFERATAWLHIFAALFAFTSDLIKPLIPRCSLLFVIYPPLGSEPTFSLAQVALGPHNAP